MTTIKPPPRIARLTVTGKRKGGTASTRNHSFQSFSQRIAKLNIDPVRRVRRHIDDEVTEFGSYFKTALEEQKDLNLSESFTDFSKEVSPFCDSLAQLVHFQDKIMDLLISYIEKREALSLEPLLSLLAHFAHDLNIRFEKHFSRAVTLVASVAAKHSSVEVIEWSFTCLAWLFKYLSRLLVPDLRPLFDIMAPLLGKESQKPFVTRFAAESMSFLLRKASVASHKDAEPLRLIIEHAFGDIKKSSSYKNAAQYQQGLMTLFTETIVGLNRGLQSSGHVTFKYMLDEAQIQVSEAETLVEDIVIGSLIATIHHTEGETFGPILNSIRSFVLVDTLDSASDSIRPQITRLHGRLLYTAMGVRKGSRIVAWSPISAGLTKLLTEMHKQNGAVNVGSGARWEMFKATAVLLQYAPIDCIVPHLNTIMDGVMKGANEDLFLPFCSFLAGMGKDRFKSLVQPYFERYMSPSNSLNLD
jgi:U3 small nucleolar RNA-associated protein 20